ncbi:hypothetical protein [Alkalihalobacillus pseudalcaliphilus]|nr:hypothetical protein [Alkalihalobacillus pseudalcaliphilus]
MKKIIFLGILLFGLMLGASYDYDLNTGEDNGGLPGHHTDIIIK